MNNPRVLMGIKRVPTVKKEVVKTFSSGLDILKEEESVGGNNSTRLL